MVKNPPANIAGVKVKVTPSYLTLCDSIDYTGILQARILEWVAILFSSNILDMYQPEEFIFQCHIFLSFHTFCLALGHPD